MTIDDEKVVVPEEVNSRIKTKEKKGSSSLKLLLEWETKPPKRTQKRDEKAKEVTLANGQKAGQKPGQEADAKDAPATRLRDHDSHVLVCVGGDCKKRGSKGVCKALRAELLASDILGDVRIDTVDCLGLCKHGPNAVVYEGAEPKGTW